MKKYSIIKCAVLVIVISLLLPAMAFSQTDPKGAFYAPPDTSALIWYFRHIEGHEGFNNGEKLSKNADLRADLSIFRYAYYNKVGVIPWHVSLIVPFGAMHLEKGAVNQTSTGFGDTQVAGTLWLIDNPKNNFYFYLSGYVTTPTGDYHNDQALNMGNNRWAFKPEIAFAWKPLKKLSLELLGSVEYFTKNGDYLMGQDLKKDPLYGVFGHVTYDITDKLFLAASAFYWYGGETEVGGVDRGDKTQTTQGMLTTGVKVTPSTQFLLQLKHDFDVKNGTGQDAFQTRLAFFF